MSKKPSGKTQKTKRLTRRKPDEDRVPDHPELQAIFRRQQRSKTLADLRGDSKWVDPFGAVPANIMFVGCMANYSRELLDTWLYRVHIRKRHCYFTDLFKHWGTGNPTPEQYDRAYHYLAQEIEVVQPTVIVPVGQTALHGFLDEPEPISHWVGEPMEWGDSWLITIQRPCLAAMFEEDRDQMLEAIQQIAWYADV